MSEALSGVALLAARCAGVAEVLEAALAVPLPALLLEGPLWFTGIGVAEGPARLCAEVGAGLGLVSRFVPLSCFHGPSGETSPERAGTLVLFSQGLSPNARLALRAKVARRVLITAVPPPKASDAPESAAAQVAQVERGGALVLRHGPLVEDQILLRVQGPAAASLLGLRLLVAVARAAGRAPSWEGLLPQVPAAVLAAAGVEEAAQALHGPLAFVTSGGYGELCHGLRWKLLEGLWREEPPCWDVLQVAHGPLQSFYGGSMTLLGLRRPEEPEALYQRLRQVLVPARHALLLLPARLPAPLCFFEHDAQCNALLLRALQERPRDLRAWPARGRDQALYDLGLSAAE